MPDGVPEELPDEAPSSAEEGPAVAGLALPLSQNTWGIMNKIIATLMPKTLKFTQTLSVKFRAT